MRRSWDAAVDTVGAEALKHTSAGTPVEVRFQVMKTATTKDRKRVPLALEILPIFARCVRLLGATIAQRHTL